MAKKDFDNKLPIAWNPMGNVVVEHTKKTISITRYRWKKWFFLKGHFWPVHESWLLKIDNLSMLKHYADVQKYKLTNKVSDYYFYLNEANYNEYKQWAHTKNKVAWPLG